MTIFRFINEINAAFPDEETFRKKMGNNVNYETFKTAHTLLSYTERNLDIVSFADLLKHSNLCEVTIGSFSFFSEIVARPNSVNEFGIFNDFYLIAENSAMEVISYSDIFEDLEIVSPNLEFFMEILIEYNSYDKQVIFSNENNLNNYNKTIDDYIKKGFSRSWLSQLFVR